MKKRWITLIVFVALLGLGALKISQINWTDYRPQLESQISQALGAEVRLNGKLFIAFFPYPKLEAENAELQARGIDIHAPALRLSVKLWPLLRGHVVLSSAEIDSPDIRVMPELWAPSRHKKSGEEMPHTNVQLQNIEINDGRIVITLRGHGEVLEDVSLDLRAPDWHGPYHVEGDFTWQNLPLEFETSLGVVTPAGSRALNFNIKQSDTVSNFFWHGAFIAAPFALHGEWQDNGAAAISAAQRQKKPEARCPPNTLVYLTSCFLFQNSAP